MKYDQDNTLKTQAARSVFIIDDHPLMRMGIMAMLALEPDLEVCGESSQISGAVDSISHTRPDIILTDLNLPDGSGLTLIKDIRNAGIKVPILVISINAEDDFAERALKVGANGYLMKHMAPDMIIEGIRVALNGDIYVSEAFTKTMLKRYSFQNNANQSGKCGLELLTDREFEVMQLIGRGKPTREIAKALSISPKTVEAHRTHMRTKLNLSSGTELIRYAIEWRKSNES